MAKRNAQLPGQERQALLACLLENAPQSVERRFQPCSQALQAENQPRRPGRQYGQGQGPGNAVLDESGVSEIC